MIKRIKKIAFAGILLALIGFITTFWANKHIKNKAEKYIYTSVDSIPDNAVGLVLGTVKNQKNGKPNLYFVYRINAAVELFKAGKVKHFIVSGDNHIEGYDEPEDMRQALIANGVPDSCITLDYAGFRTLDSIIRCKAVFGQSKFTIISQQFHNERAIFLARYHDMDVYAYNAQSVNKHYGFRTNMREYLARVKATLDVYILKKKPKFLGEPVEIKL